MQVEFMFFRLPFRGLWCEKSIIDSRMKFILATSFLYGRQFKIWWHLDREKKFNLSTKLRCFFGSPTILFIMKMVQTKASQILSLFKDEKCYIKWASLLLELIKYCVSHILIELIWLALDSMERFICKRQALRLVL